MATKLLSLAQLPNAISGHLPLLLLLLLLLQIVGHPFCHCLPSSLLSSTNSTTLTSNQPQSNNQPVHQTRFKRFKLDEPLIDRSPLPMLYIGEVTLASFPECEAWLEPHRLHCQRRYEAKLHREVVHHNMKRGHRLKSSSAKFSYDRNSEDIKRVSCCGMWHARICVIEAITTNLPKLQNPTKICPDNLINLYLQLPNDKDIKADVMDYCSEYGDGTLICAHSSATSTTKYFSWTNVLILVFSILILNFYSTTLDH